LKAGIIVMDYEKNEVYAGRIRDSTGTLTQYPNFKQGANVIEPDSIRFNFNAAKHLPRFPLSVNNPHYYWFMVNDLAQRILG